MEEAFIIGDLKSLKIKIEKDPENSFWYRKEINKIIKNVKNNCILLLDDNDFVEKELEMEENNIKFSCLYRMNRPSIYIYPCKINEINFNWFSVKDLVCIVFNPTFKNKIDKKDNVFLIETNKLDSSLLKASNYFSHNLLISIDFYGLVEKNAYRFERIFFYTSNNIIIKNIKSKKFNRIYKIKIDNNTKFNNFAISFKS